MITDDLTKLELDTWPSIPIGRHDDQIFRCDIEGDLGLELKTARQKIHIQLSGLDALFEPETGDDSFFSKLFTNTGLRNRRILHNEPMLSQASQLALNIGRWLFAPSQQISTFQLGKHNANSNLNYGFVRGESNDLEAGLGHYRYYPVLGLDSFVLEHLNSSNIDPTDRSIIYEFIRLAVFFGGHDHVHQSVYTIQDPENPTSFCHISSDAAKYPIPNSIFNTALRQTIPTYLNFSLPIEAYSSCIASYGWDIYNQRNPEFLYELAKSFYKYFEAVIRTTSIRGSNSDQEFIRRYLTVLPLVFINSITDIRSDEFLNIHVDGNQSLGQMIERLSIDGLERTLDIAQSLGIESHRNHPRKNELRDEAITWTIRYNEILSTRINADL